jgi:hypothetical protein
MEPHNDRPPLTDISASGTFKLKLIKPKFEKIKAWDDGTVSARLFFVDDKGFCLTKSYGSKYGKSLAMLVGKFSGSFVEKELRIDATPAEFLEYITPACGKTCIVGVEVTPDGEYNGRARYKYSLKFPKGSQKPIVNEAPAIDEANPPF